MLALFTSTVGAINGYGGTIPPTVELTYPSSSGVSGKTGSPPSSVPFDPDEAPSLLVAIEELRGIVWFNTTKDVSLIVALLSCAEIDRSSPDTASSSERRAGVAVFIFKSDRETL